MSFKKTPFELIWAPFCQFYGKQEFIWKIRFCHIFVILDSMSTAVQNVREN